MNVFDSAQTTKRSNGLLTGMLLLFCAMTATAQQPSDRIDPRQTGWKQLPVIGTMTGIQYPETSGAFGRTIHPVGDCNGDGLADWLVGHRIIVGVGAIELLLYKGVEGGIPKQEDGVRVGPDELHSHSTFIASGDWDGDGHVDLATRIQILGDTSLGNVNADYTFGVVAVWWGNENGTYSVADTSHLECGTDRWLGTCGGESYDFDDNGAEDLLIWTCSGYGYDSGQVIVRIPKLLLFSGKSGVRWGQSGGHRSPSWWWWEPVIDINRLEMLDQDCDGAEDLVLYTDEGGVTVGGGHIAILYGNPDGGFPDTSAVVHRDLSDVNGHMAQLIDVSGDGVLELVLGCWATRTPSEDDEMVKIYAGEPGQRIAEQYGSGDDPPAPEEERYYSRPWAEIWMPRKLDDVWPLSGSLVDLGDANLDGLNDIWVLYSSHFIIEYNSGRFLDSLIDAMILPPRNLIHRAVPLGDIDGSGLPTIAVGYTELQATYPNPFPGAVMFLHPNKWIPNGGVYRAPFHEPGIRCGTATAVPQMPEDGSAMTITAMPNPATGQVRVTWHNVESEQPVNLSIHDALGREVCRRSVDAGTGTWVWDAAGMVGGVYYITLHVGEHSSSVRVLLRK